MFLVLEHRRIHLVRKEAMIDGVFQNEREVRHRARPDQVENLPEQVQEILFGHTRPQK